MRTQEATAFEREYYETDGRTKGRTVLKVRRVLKTKMPKREYNGTNEPAAKFIHWVKVTPKVMARLAMSKTWVKKHTYNGSQSDTEFKPTNWSSKDTLYCANIACPCSRYTMLMESEEE